MKIIELRAENIKRLKAVEIKPKGNVVIISGKNDQGKSSVIDALWLVLRYADVSKEIVHPIREGQKKASVSVRLKIEKSDEIKELLGEKELLVTRHWTSESKSYLKIEAGKNFYTTTPQKLIDTFVGAIGFDPLKFARMREKEQRNLLLSLINLGIDLDEIENQKRNIYDERTVIGRELKRAEASIEEIPEQVNYADEEINIVELSKELNRQIENNRKIKDKRDDIIKMRKMVEEKENEIKYLEKEISDYAEGIDEKMKFLNENKEIDIAETQHKIEKTEEINREVRKRKQNEENLLIAEKLRSEYGEKTKSIEDLEDKKKAALAGAIMPIEKLGVDEYGVTYKGYPFKDLSDSEKLKISLAIMMALKPKLRLLTIKDGSLLDEKNLKVIKTI